MFVQELKALFQYLLKMILEIFFISVVLSFIIWFYLQKYFKKESKKLKENYNPLEDPSRKENHLTSKEEIKEITPSMIVPANSSTVGLGMLKNLPSWDEEGEKDEAR